MPTKHSLLSPSSSARWMNCTPSARLEALMPSEESTFAREGTLAHSIGELRLRQVLMPQEIKDIDKYIDEFAHLRQSIIDEGFDLDEVYTKVLDVYCQYVESDYKELQAKGKSPIGLVEQRLSLEPQVPDTFGTSDAVIISDEELSIYDLKYGKGVKVNAVDNPQMLCYALGAYNKYAKEHKFKAIRMTIIQPRLNWISEWVIDAAELVDWADNNLKPKASIAAAGKGKQCTGKHCKFCNILGLCKEAYTEAKALDTTDKILSREELSEALKIIPQIETWINRVKEQALQLMLRGEKVEGYKVVEGRALTKVINQEGLIANLLKNGYTEEQIIKPKEVKTLTELKKVLKKSFSDLTQEFTAKGEGKPTIVEENDPREAINRQEQANNEFTKLLNN